MVRTMKEFIVPFYDLLASLVKQARQSSDNRGQIRIADGIFLLDLPDKTSRKGRLAPAEFPGVAQNTTKSITFDTGIGVSWVSCGQEIFEIPGEGHRMGRDNVPSDGIPNNILNLGSEN